MSMAIHLTDQQRQAIEAQQGRPVEVVDPVTKRTYLLIAAETYERFRDVLESKQSAGLLETPAAAASEGPQGAAEPSPMRQPLKDLVTPPEVAEEARRYCKKLGLSRKKYRVWAEDELKLQYYFGGRYVGFLNTAEGMVVVAAGRLGSEEFDRQLAALSPQERQNVILDAPCRWHDEVSTILTPFAYED
jgi:hypothetical protein